MRSEPVIAIDGPAGSGKSTLARRLAGALGLPYVNTGLMYRALTLEALRVGVDPGDGPGLAGVMRAMRFDLTSTTELPSLEIDGEMPLPELTGPDVERSVSEVSRHPEVRSMMRAAQRSLGERGAVMEGRDIGSVVFPEAEVKIFLIAESAERVARRMLERAGGAADELVSRDEQDARVNPFVPAEDAVVIDTTSLDADGVYDQALAIVGERLRGDR